MPSSWNVYYVVFLSALLALGIPAVLALISYFVSTGKVKNRLHTEVFDGLPTENQTLLGQRINARFFLGVNAALILIALILVMIPCVGQFADKEDKGRLARGLVAIVTISGFAALGLLYSVRKGDLSWVEYYQNKTKERLQ